MSFENSCSGVFTVYRIFGLVPSKFHFQSSTAELSRTFSNKKRQICRLFAEKLWFSCLLLFEFYNLIHSSILNYKKFFNIYSISSFNVFRLLMIITIRVCIILITIESYRHRKVQVKILDNLREIDRVFERKLKLHINYHRLKRSIFVALLKWIPIYFVAVSIFISANLFEETKIEDVICVALTLYPLLKQALFGSAYVTYAILIKCRLQAMHEVLDSNLLLAHVESPSFEMSIDRESRREREAFEFQRLIYLWRLFPRVHETVQLMNDTFKWSISVNFFADVFYICAVVFSYLNEILRTSHEKDTILSNISISYMFYCGIFCFRAIIPMAESVAAEADKIAPKIHRLSWISTISEELQHFVSKI